MVTLSSKSNFSFTSADYSIKIVSELTPAEKSLFEPILANNHYGSIITHWIEIIQKSCPKNYMDLYYVPVCYQGRPQALAIVYILNKFDLLPYIHPKLKTFSNILQKIGLHPLRLNLMYIEIPLGNSYGLLVAEGTSLAQEADIFARVHRLLKEHFTSTHALSIKVEPSKDVSANLVLNQLNLLPIPYLNKNYLPLQARNFDEFIKGLKSKRRSDVKRNREIFQSAGGRIVVTQEFLPYAPTLQKLYDQTCAVHNQLDEFMIPIPIEEKYFASLDNLPQDSRWLFLAYIGEEIVGFGVVILSKSQLFFKQCGLDYNLSTKTRAYFNLYYAIIELACSLNVIGIDLGTTTNLVKGQLGAKQIPTEYWVECWHWALKPIAALVKSRFDAELNKGL